MLQDYKMLDTHQRYSDVDIFSTQGRIGQKRYFVYSIVIPLVLFLAITPLAGLASHLPFASSILFNLLIALGVLIMLFMTARLTIQRCHDFNRSGNLAILALIPFANIIFALIPGTNGLNQYGEIPKPASWLFNISFVLLILVMLGISFYLLSHFMPI